MIYKTNRWEFIRDKYLFPLVFIFAPILMVAFAVKLGVEEERLKDLAIFLVVGLILVVISSVIFLPQLLFYQDVEITEDSICLENKEIAWSEVSSIKTHFNTCIKINLISGRYIFISNGNWSLATFTQKPSSTKLFLKLRDKVSGK